MFHGGDVDFSRLVDNVAVELPSWQGIATKYIAIHTVINFQSRIQEQTSFLFSVGELFSPLGLRVLRAGPP
jgi:hypothetical protein